MKSEKHVALAQNILSWVIRAQLFNDLAWDKEALDKIVKALEKFETEALASKVVFPTDEEIETEAAHWRLDNPKATSSYAFYCGAQWLRSQITLAPSEQVIRVPVIGLKEFESKVLENGFDHPCRKTCSGWTQGYDRGRFDFQEAIKRLNPQARIEESDG